MKNSWYLVNIKGEYFAETKYKSHITEKVGKKLFRDYNGDVMSLGSETKFAQSWVNTRNEIEEII